MNWAEVFAAIQAGTVDGAICCTAQSTYTVFAQSDVGKYFINFWEGLRESATTIGVVMVMVFMVLVVSRFLIFEDIPGLAKSFVFSTSDNPIVILLMVNVVMIIIGMLMDDISGLLLSAPLLLPVVTSVGMDPIHFAAVLGVNLGMANITPPTAPLLYLGARVTSTTVNEMFKPTMILIVFAWLPTLMLTTFIPATALWCPSCS